MLISRSNLVVRLLQGWELKILRGSNDLSVSNLYFFVSLAVEHELLMFINL